MAILPDRPTAKAQRGQDAETQRHGRKQNKGKDTTVID
jgi:hypothetical protein